MQRALSRIIKYYKSTAVVVVLGLCFFLSSCANVQAPPGGPEDKTAPFVDTSGLASGTVNFAAKELWVQFSEYVDKGKVIENIFLSPEKRLEYSWSGKELTIRFAEPLDSNTTYSLTLGTDYTDLRGNKPASAHTIVFSTGSRLDSCTIQGTLDDANPAGVYAFLYPLSGINPDTLDYTKTKPRYRTQVGTDKSFIFKALTPGLYRVVAVRDQLKNGLYDQGDGYGTMTHDITLQQGEPTVVKLRVGNTLQIQAPELIEVRSSSSRTLEAFFSTPIDTLSVDAKHWIVSDTLDVNPMKVLAAHISTRSPKNVTVYTERMDSIKYRRVRVQGDTDRGLRDSVGNRLPDSLATQIFSTSTEVDSTPPTLLRTSIRDSVLNISRLPEIRFVFSSALQRTSVEKSIVLYQGTVTVPTRVLWRGDNEFAILPADSLRSDTWYELRCKSGTMKGVFGANAKDSTIRLRFKTLDVRNLSTIKAVLLDSTQSSCKNYVVTLTNTKTNLQRTVKLNKAGIFIIYGCEEGDYTMQVFCDEDGNGVYSSGSLSPFRFAEVYTIRPETIPLKARWTIEDLVIVLKK
ncbi:MAG: Ig-like domain-containing protein [Candidatus Kapabacteria bacterium]|nr:Ig-like domain-containing protein [Candidatus Kapabacteria bacterium]